MDFGSGAGAEDDCGRRAPGNRLVPTGRYTTVTPDVFPVAILDVEEGAYYMLPICGTPGVKIGLHHHRGERGHADALSREPGSAERTSPPRPSGGSRVTPR
jgi:hypothetical protein